MAVARAHPEDAATKSRLVSIFKEEWYLIPVLAELRSDE
jgi:hypothetical protein